jgi:hypothetical protein
MAKRKIGNSHTTISVAWTDKEEFRKLAKLVKKTKNGDMYESDAVIFKRILDHYKNSVPNENQVIHSTYPTKSSVQEHVQQD